MLQQSECAQQQTHTRTHLHMRTPVHTHDAARTRTTSSMHYPHPRFRFKQMPAEVNTHSHTRMPVYAHNLYAPAFTCTHQNDVEYAAQVHTHTHPLLPYLHDVELMLQIHVYGSSKCLQSYIHTDAPNPRFHTQNEVEYACSKSTFSV